MASSTFVLSGATMSHSHNRGHGHGHKHSRSRSPAPLGTLNRSFKFEVSSPASPPKHTHHHDHDHGPLDDTPHSHDHHDHHDHDPDPFPHRSPMQARDNTPSPLSAVNGWKRSSTSGGKPLVTPTNASFYGHYTAPAAKTTPPAHDHSVERSRFTKMLLPHTAKWPMLHAIMTEKDSRRIFYFMR